MFRTLIITLFAACSLGAASASAAPLGTSFNNAEVLAKLGSYFTRWTYAGVDQAGKYCKVDVFKQPYWNLPVGQLTVTGFNHFPMPQPGNILRQVGYFGLALDPRWYVVQKAEFSDVKAEVTVHQRNGSNPVIYGVTEWIGTITLLPSASGKDLGSIKIEERWFDPSSNATTTRTFFCGERR